MICDLLLPIRRNEKKATNKRLTIRSQWLLSTILSFKSQIDCYFTAQLTGQWHSIRKYLNLIDFFPFLHSFPCTWMQNKNVRAWFRTIVARSVFIAFFIFFNSFFLARRRWFFSFSDFTLANHSSNRRFQFMLFIFHCVFHLPFSVCVHSIEDI